MRMIWMVAKTFYISLEIFLHSRYQLKCMNPVGLSLVLSHVVIVFKNTYNIHTQEHQKKPFMVSYDEHFTVFELEWKDKLLNQYSYMVLCVFIVLYGFFQSYCKNEATYVAILSENDMMNGVLRPAMPCYSHVVQTHDQYQQSQTIYSGAKMRIETKNLCWYNWKFSVFELKASIWNCNVLWECIVHFFEILGVPLVVPLYVVWAFFTLKYDTPVRPTAPGVTQHHLVTLREGCEDFCKRVKLGFCQGLILVVRSSVVSSSMDISMMIVLAAIFVVQCDRKWSSKVPITSELRNNVTSQDMSHLWSRNASAAVTLVTLDIDTVNFAFHYYTVLSRVLMDLVIAMYTMNAHEHGVKVLCLVRVISFAYFLKLWNAPLHFLFTYNRGAVFLQAWIGVSGCSVASIWKSLKNSLNFMHLPEYIFESAIGTLEQAWTWHLNFIEFMTGVTAEGKSASPSEVFDNIFVTRISEFSTIIRTNIVMICCVCLLLLWISAPRENEVARRLFCGHIFHPKLPWLLSDSNTRYLHLICFTVSSLVYYETWGLNQAPHKLPHTPQSFLQMSIADTIIAACIVFLCCISRSLQFFFPRMGTTINMSKDSVLQLGSLSSNDYDIVLVTRTTQTVFGNLDRKDYYAETVAFPCKLDLCVREIMQVFAEPIQRLPIEAACIGFAENGVLKLLSKEHSSERSKKRVLPAAVAATGLPAAVAAREGISRKDYVIAILFFLVVVQMPWGAIIATCSQSVATARHSFSGFMAWGHTTATGPRPVFGPQNDPNKKRKNADKCNGETGGPNAEEKYKNATGGASQGTTEGTVPPPRSGAGGPPPGQDAGGASQGTKEGTVPPPRPGAGGPPPGQDAGGGSTAANEGINGDTPGAKVLASGVQMQVKVLASGVQDLYHAVVELPGHRLERLYK